MKHSFSVWGRVYRLLSFAIIVATAPTIVAQNQRLLGIDVSAHQGSMSQTTWSNIATLENRKFTIIRASRGGTTGEDHRQGGYPAGDRFYDLSCRYDDPYFVQNLNRATAAGMLVGSYHFSRPDVIAGSTNSSGQPIAVSNNGTDEADHFMQMAGAWMRPGYLIPVHDFEAGDGLRTDEEMAQFCVDFSNRIYEKMKIRPAIYLSGNYAENILGGASQALRDQLAQPAATLPSVVSPCYPTLWTARWPNGSGNQYTGNIQTDEPDFTVSYIYGPWDDYGTVRPWIFWQYSSGERLQSFNSGNSNLDADVAHGGMEFLEDQLVPAVWWNDSSGAWTTLTNWNSGQTPLAPVISPGQLTPAATGPLPTPRLPSTNDTVILERPDVNITVTLSSGAQNIRKLYVREALNITGGSLTINYTPSPDSTTNGAQFSAPVSINNATLNVHTLQIEDAQTFTLGSGGTVKFSKMVLMPGTPSATLTLTGNPTFDALTNGVCSVVNGSGSGNSGKIDLSAGTRTVSVNSGADVSLDMPISNGALTKSGAGTLRLTSANGYTGGTVVNAGKLFVNNTTGSGTGSGTVTVNGGTLGGTGVISGAPTINAGGTIAPGTDTTIGTLTLSSSPVLNGTNFFKVNRNGGSPLADKISRTGGALTFGGKLVVTNVGAALTGGEVFALFSATSFNGTFTSTNLPPLDPGLNWDLGNLTVDGTIRVTTVSTPPTITVQPQSTNVPAGQNATFTVGAYGTAPLYYQWWFQSNPVSGANASTLVVTNVTTNQLGNYFVTVSNAYGSVTSQVATLTLTPPGPLQLLWQLAPYSRPYLTSTHTNNPNLPEQRGMTYNPVTRRLLLVHRLTPTVYVLDAETGTNLWTLNTNNVTGGLTTAYYLLLIAAADDGAIYACNLKASSAPFKIYRWADDSSNAVPTVAFSGDPSPGTPSYRWGDTFDVRGSGTNTQILIGPRQGTNVVLFTTTDGLNFTSRVINLNGIPEGHCGLNVTFGNGNTFWGTTHTNLLRLVSFDPVAGTASTLRLYNDSEVPTNVNPIGYSSSLNMLAGIHVFSPNHLRVYDLTPTNGVPSLIGTTNFPSDNDNTHTGTGAVRFGGDTIYALDSNNGLMAVRLGLPSGPLRISEMSMQAGQLILRGAGTAGNHVVEASSASLTNWVPAGNIAIGMNGSFEFRENLTNALQRFYRIRKQ